MCIYRTSLFFLIKKMLFEMKLACDSFVISHRHWMGKEMYINSQRRETNNMNGAQQCIHSAHNIKLYFQVKMNISLLYSVLFGCSTLMCTFKRFDFIKHFFFVRNIFLSPQKYIESAFGRKKKRKKWKKLYNSHPHIHWTSREKQFVRFSIY